MITSAKTITTVLADEVLSQVSALLETRIGLKSEPSFRPRLARVLGDVTVTRRLDPLDLLAAMKSNSAVIKDVIDRVTVQESGFFRHPEQFSTLVDTVFPQIAGPLHIWCAAAANGQEAYSLAIALREAGRDGRVFATDIAESAVERTRLGVYDERELRGVSRSRLDQYFAGNTTTRTWRVKPHIRELVSCRIHNLLDPIPDEVQRCQIVFCRNVLIYLTNDHAASYLDRLSNALSPEAFLIVGSAETIWHINDRFEPIQHGQAYVYRQRQRKVGRVRVEVAAPLALAPLALAPQPETPPRPKPLVAVTPVSSPAPPSSALSTPIASDSRSVGQELLDAGDIAAAVVEFRRWAYMAPMDPHAHFHLGTALAKSGDSAAARRAFRSALASLDRVDIEVTASILEGYDRKEFRRLLLSKCDIGPPQPTTQFRHEMKEPAS